MGEEKRMKEKRENRGNELQCLLPILYLALRIFLSFFRRRLGNKISVKQCTHTSPVFGCVEVHIVNYKCHNIIIMRYILIVSAFVHLPLRALPCNVTQCTHQQWQ